MNTAAKKSLLPLERCIRIARMVHGPDLDDQEITRIAEELRVFAATFPPLTQEQIDKVRVLLRPESWGPTVHTGEQRPG